MLRRVMIGYCDRSNNADVMRTVELHGGFGRHRIRKDSNKYRTVGVFDDFVKVTHKPYQFDITPTYLQRIYEICTYIENI